MIALVRKKVVYSILVLGFVLAATLYWHEQSSNSCTFVSGNKCVLFERADTVAKRAKGLSGRTGMPADRGMLFVFENPSDDCFWMKDMQFSIDIVWLDASRTVLKTAERVAPETYPERFCPSSPALYVLELQAGAVSAAGIQTGDRVKL